MMKKMMKNKKYKKHYIALFIALLLCFSCMQNRFEFANYEIQKIREIESEDHKFCINLGLDFDVDEIETEIYWRCKIILANHKLIHDESSPDSIKHNLILKKYIIKLEDQFEKSFENLNNYRNKFINDQHHKICERQGNKISSLNQDEVERYLDCRYDLIKTYQINPPYKKTHYLEYGQDSYNIGFVINMRQDEEIKRFEEERLKYPHCVFLGIKTKEYQECKKDYDLQQKCFKDALKSRFQKELEEREICQEKLYKRFPESLLKDEEEKNDFDRAKIAADIYNLNNFRSIGIDDDMLKTFQNPEDLKKEEEEKLKKKEEKKEQKQSFNNDKKLYSKAELTALKESFIATCGKNLNSYLEKYYDNLKYQCKIITLKWELKSQNKYKNQETNE